MSACDSKSELVAIYRLEFYKKQKNWKLSTTRHDKNCPEKQHKKQVEKNEKKPNLNITYSCMERGNEDQDQLNVAFVEAESENIQNQPNLSKKFQLSQEWQEPVNIWPPEIASKNNYGTPNTNQYTSGEFLKHDENYPTCDDSEGTTPGRKNAMERVEELLKLQGYEEEQNNLNMMKETDWRNPEGYGCTGYVEEWPMRSALLLSAGHMAREIWEAEAEASDAVDGDCPEDPVYFGPWIQPSIRPGPPPGFEHAMEGSWDMSVDSFGEFSRGADAAPHSSEIDLTLPPPVDIADVGFTLLSRLSSQQLLHATELHSRVLHRLLMESEQRQRLRDCARCDSGSGDEPTRDPGPYLPLPLSPCRGRGRGRLPRPDLWG